MEILDEGYDCKGRFYKKIPLKRCQDLTNQKFNLLTPLFRVEGKTTNWLCQCDCGNLTVVSARHLKAKEVKACGMNHKQYDKTDKHIGEKFGELILVGRVIKEDVVRKDKAYWKCLCSCGKTTIVAYDNLVSGITKSCGHLKAQYENLSGKNFSYWTVLENYYISNNKYYWQCKCKCGTIKYVRADQLKNGNSQSCGCKHESYGAQTVENILNDNNLSYVKEYCFKDLKSPLGGALRFDFAIFENNKIKFLIEYDGELHFQERKGFTGKNSLEYRKLCDKIKNDYCLNHQIPLHRISYLQIKDFSYNKLLNNEYLIS